MVIVNNPAQLALAHAAVREERVPARAKGRRELAAVGLFAGIGGIERGLAAGGHRALMLCEIEPTARAVLDEHFPTVAKHDDVTTLKALPKGTELLAGGFP
jgi:site-specific DNA-cytosine methylase